MRKLTTLGCSIVACCTLFWACQKDDNRSFFDPPESLETTPSVNSQVFEANSQIFDIQHFKTKSDFALPAQPAPKRPNLSRLTIRFFSLFEGEKEAVFTIPTLESALIAVGLNGKEINRRIERIFNSTHCSPHYLATTAELLAPILPPHTEGVYICELHKPNAVTQTETFDEAAIRNSPNFQQFKKIGFGERVKDVNKLVGVSGSIAAFGDSQVELFLANDANEAISYRIHYQTIRTILQQKHGYTEGEDLYLKLILGKLTEHEVWVLFETDIYTEWLKSQRMVTSSRLTRLYFRYNYVEISGSTGRLGYTIYDLDGFTD